MKTVKHVNRIAFIITGCFLITCNSILNASENSNNRAAPLADAPVLDKIETADLLYTRGDGAVKITGTITVSDRDSRNLRSASIRITSGFTPAEDFLRYNNGDGIKGSWNQQTGVLTLTGRSSVSNYRDALRRVQYENTNQTNPSTVTRTVSFTVNDGELNSNAVSRNIVLLSPNSAPRLSAMETSPVTSCLYSGALQVTSSLLITDPDNAHLAGATVQFTNGYEVDEDELSFSDQNGIEGSWDPSGGTLTLSGEALVEDYQAALRSIKYENTNTTDPQPGSRSITFTVSDGENKSNSATRNINVNGRVSGRLTGSTTMCSDDIDNVPLNIDFSGTSPWSFTLSRNDQDIQKFSNIYQDPYTFFVDQEGTYRITSVSDANCAGDTTGSGYAMIWAKPSPTAVISGTDTICSGGTAELQIALSGTAPWSITYLRNGSNPTVVNDILSANFNLEVTATGSYTLSRVEDANCSGKVSGTGIVRQYAQPKAVMSGTASVCEFTPANLTVTLTGMAPWRFSYRRNTHDPVQVENVNSSPRTIPVYQTGTYTLVEVYDRNCPGTVSGSAVITISPAPEVTITGLAPAYSVTTFKVPVFGNPAGGVFAYHPALIDPPPADTMFFFPVVAGVGTHYIIYSYQSPTTLCYGYDTAVVSVLLNSASINFENNRKSYCKNDVPFAVQGVNLGNVTGSFTISGNSGLVDNHDNTATIYPAVLNPGEYTITYSYYYGNMQTVQANFTVAEPPVADFAWESECYHQGQSVLFKDVSSPSSGTITNHKWKIFTGTGYDSLLTKNIEYTFPEPGIYNISLQILTSKGCKSSAIKIFGLKPVIVLKDSYYSEDFEDRPASWQKVMPSGATVNSWMLGDPVKGFVGSPSGANCWYTHLPEETVPREQSWVTSPCFDFTGTVKPMLKLDIWRIFNALRDGAVLQASIDSGKSWPNIGQLLDGVNWFNEYNIQGNPGGQPIGWSNTIDAGWVESRHSLDNLRNKKDVQFRIAYGSDGTARNTQGIAFDNIWIGERNRTALVEHFTNMSDEESVAVNQQLNGIMNEDSLSLIDLQYHTSFPGEDIFNEQEPVAPGTRALYYGLTDVPYTLLNGGTKSAHRFDYDLKPLDAAVLHVESLRDSEFWINIISQLNGTALNAEVEVSALADIPMSELTIHVAVIERRITVDPGNNGETTFESVVKKLLPDVAGTTVYKSWNKGEAYRIEPEWDIQNVYDPEELRIVAFIQDESTREVYQAAMDTVDIITGIEDLLPGVWGGNAFMIYPNPAIKEARVKFSAPTTEDIRIEMYNNLGGLVYSGKIPEGTVETVIPVDDIPDGVYMIRMMDRNGLAGTGKLIK